MLPSPTPVSQSHPTKNSSKNKQDEEVVPSSQAVRPREERYDVMKQRQSSRPCSSVCVTSHLTHRCAIFSLSAVAGSSHSPESGVGSRKALSKAPSAVGSVKGPVAKSKTRTTERDGARPEALSKQVFGGSSSELSEAPPKPTKASAKRKRIDPEEPAPAEETVSADSSKKKKKLSKEASPGASATSANEVVTADPDPSQPTGITSSLADPPPRQAAPRVPYGQPGRKRSAPPPSLETATKFKAVSEHVGRDEVDDDDHRHGRDSRNEATEAKPASSDAGSTLR